MATLEEYMARDKLADIAKGRYNKKRVEEMFRSAVSAACKETERLVFEYAVLMCLQELHYEFGFGNKRLQKLITGFSEKAVAFDSGAYDMEDLRNALKEDTGIELSITWCKNEKA